MQVLKPLYVTYIHRYTLVGEKLCCVIINQLITLLEFQLPRGNHDQSIASNGRQREDQTILQHSQVCQHGEFWHESVSERQQLWPCGQNLHVHFLRTVLPMKVEESTRAMAADSMTNVLASSPSRRVSAPKLYGCVTA